MKRQKGMNESKTFLINNYILKHIAYETVSI